MTTRSPAGIRLRAAVRGQRARWFAFDRDEISIGRNEANDLVFDHESVSGAHARLLVREGRFILVDLKSATGTRVEDRPLTAPTIVREGERIEMGAYELVITSSESIDEEPWTLGTTFGDDCATERAFLDAIERWPHDDDVRVVYADWLEEQGHREPAEYLRAHVAIKGLAAEHPKFQELAARIDLLAPTMPRRWRRTVARPVLEMCDLRFEVACPKRWDGLSPTGSPNERFCHVCRQAVVYTSSLPEARRLASLGKCIAVDVPAPEYSPGDIRASQKRRPTLVGRIA